MKCKLFVSIYDLIIPNTNHLAQIMRNTNNQMVEKQAKLFHQKKLQKNNSLFFGVTGWAHYEWDPRNYGWFFPAAWPVIRYTKHL